DASSTWNSDPNRRTPEPGVQRRGGDRSQRGGDWSDHLPRGPPRQGGGRGFCRARGRAAAAGRGVARKKTAGSVWVPGDSRRPAQRGEGVRVVEVTPGSPADRGQLRAGDTILAVNGTPLRDNDDLFLAVGGLLAGSEAKLDVRSPGAGRQVHVANVTLAKFFV